MLRKALLGSYCIVVWVLFLVFCFLCFTSLGVRNTKNLPIFCFNTSTAPLNIMLFVEHNLKIFIMKYIEVYSSEVSYILDIR